VLPCGETRDTCLKHPLMSGIADARCACDPVGRNSDALGPRRGRQPRRRSSRTRPKEEAQSTGPDSWAGYTANSGIIRPAIQVERGESFGLDQVSGIGGTQAKASECHPRRIANVVARQGLLLHTDSHYVNPVSSRKRVPTPTGLAEHAYTAVGPARHTCCLL
jgi:hypothetical protein